MVKVHRKEDTITIILKPNQSATWKQNKAMIVIVSTFVMLIAIGWSIVGAWLIMPFAGLEVGLLAFLIYQSSYSTYQKQILTIEKNSVTVQEGVYYPRQTFCFDKLSLYIQTEEAINKYEQTLIHLIDKQQKLEIGHFLNENDRKKMIKLLKMSGLHIQTSKWWLSESL